MPVARLARNDCVELKTVFSNRFETIMSEWPWRSRADCDPSWASRSASAGQSNAVLIGHIGWNTVIDVVCLFLSKQRVQFVCVSVSMSSINKLVRSLDILHGFTAFTNIVDSIIMGYRSHGLDGRK